jgi:hypothetical protein
MLSTKNTKTFWQEREVGIPIAPLRSNLLTEPDEFRKNKLDKSFLAVLNICRIGTRIVSVCAEAWGFALAWKKGFGSLGCGESGKILQFIRCFRRVTAAEVTDLLVQLRSAGRIVGRGGCK